MRHLVSQQSADSNNVLVAYASLGGPTPRGQRCACNVCIGRKTESAYSKHPLCFGEDVHIVKYPCCCCFLVVVFLFFSLFLFFLCFSCVVVETIRKGKVRAS